MTKTKKPVAIKTDSGEILPVQFIRKNIKSWRLLLMTSPPRQIRVRDKNSHKLIFSSK